MLKHLNHPNIVPFKGVTLEPLQLVSEWVPGKDLREHLKINGHANLIGLVNTFFLVQKHDLILSSVARRRRRSWLSSLV